MSNSELPTWDAAYSIANGIIRAGEAFGIINLDGWSNWMCTRLTHRLADVVHLVGKPTPGVTYLIPLGNRVPVPGSDDDRTCDRCEHFVPWDAADDEFYVLTIVLMGNVTVCGGLCAPCMAMENPQGVLAHA